ncbi:hypothetical protein HF086_014085 [Spodoptera exigua]|uniref:RIIa domain-containing protein n=1 Tax=Spodoptera exigua TaxID=7107 RepID=A0A922MLH9_SPOEX|nr:hypothetical protein HF086_014085 [Spodoptera exigua]
MPPGLVNLVQELSRDVLKNNPTDIYGYCANHFKQLLEIRDGPLVKKKLTLEEKIAKAQEKVRQRAEQRWQQYDNEVLKQQRQQQSEIKDANKSDILIPTQEPAAVDITPLIHNEQEINNSSAAALPSLAAVSSVVALSSGLSAAAALSSAVALSTATAPSVSIVEMSDKTDTPSEDHEDSDHDHDSVINANDSNGDLKIDVNTESASNDNETKSDNSVTESLIPISDNVSENPIKIPEAKVIAVAASENLNNLSEPIVNEHLKSDDPQQIRENEESTTLDKNLQITVESIPTNDRIVENEKSDDEKSTIKTETDGKIEENDVIESNLLVEPVRIENYTVENLPKEIINPKTQHSNETESIKIDKVVLADASQLNAPENGIKKLENDDIKKQADSGSQLSQETNQFEISFKESPTVELQGSRVSSDVMESLLESNNENEIMTLVLQESTNGDLEEINGFNEISATDSNSKIHANTRGTHSNKVESEQESKENRRESVKIQEDECKNLMNNAVEVDDKNEAHLENNDIQNSDPGLSKLSESSPSSQSQDNMDLETAAVTIQKVFRSFLFKSRTSTLDETVNDEKMFSDDDDKNKEECDFTIPGPLNERRPHGITRMDTVLQTVNEEKSLSLSDDSSTLSSAATIIQAHVRGFLVRNKLNSNKTISTNSQHTSYSNEPSLTSLEMDNEQNKNKTVLNIHIVPEGGNYLSRDESLITSMDLSLDSSPPSSINLHPLGYDKSERRKQLKREDAIQSISPPSNNSGKLSEDVDSVKEIIDSEAVVDHPAENSGNDNLNDDMAHCNNNQNDKAKHEATKENIATDDVETCVQQNKSLDTVNSDELDVVTPFESGEENNPSEHKLMHSGEFHDAVLPTKVSRSDTSVASGE